MTDRPPGLEPLVDSYRGCSQGLVQIRPLHWTTAMAADGPEYTALLNDAEYGSGISRYHLQRACISVDDQLSTCQAFVLVMAWGSGTIANRSIRNTRRALADPQRAFEVLASSARLLRSASEPADGALESAYRAWSLPGVRRSFFTKWFAFAGSVDDRYWQPLILDDRVLRSLNRTLGVSTHELAGSLLWSRRYVAYVHSLHRWADELTAAGVPVGAEELEWILFKHNGQTLPASPA